MLRSQLNPTLSRRQLAWRPRSSCLRRPGIGLLARTKDEAAAHATAANGAETGSPIRARRRRSTLTQQPQRSFPVDTVRELQALARIGEARQSQSAGEKFQRPTAH